MLSRRLIRIKAVMSLYAHFVSGEKELKKSQKDYRHSLEKCDELHYRILGLVTEVARYGERKIELGLAKHRPTAAELNPNRKFINNRIVALLAGSEVLEKLNVGWRGEESLIKELYNALSELPQYIAYMNSTESKFSEDRRIVAEFLENCVEESELLDEIIEEQSLFWSGDTGFAVVNAHATIRALRPDMTDIPYAPLFKDDDEQEYAILLFERALVNSSDYFALIEKLAQNWDFERIALMDKMIMLAAVAELTTFPSIPVKVTLDEYIEIAKHFSTAQSSNFINGILDKAVAVLTEQGQLEKSGRGLAQ